MDKGTRVLIHSGRQGKGKSGSIFWIGPNKYGEGNRFGVRGDDGETYWVLEADCDETKEKAPEQEPGPTFAKGDRVSFTQRGLEGTGTVFWIGQSKDGPGQRLGVRDDNPAGDEDAVWLDARQAQPLTNEPTDAAPANRPTQGRAAPTREDDELPAEAWSAPVGLDELPPAPPIEDSELDQWADAGDDDEAPPGNW